MRRRTISALALTAALASAPSATAQTTATPAASQTTAGSTALPSTVAPSSTTAPASVTAPASSAAPASSTLPGGASSTPSKGADASTEAIVLLATIGLLLLGAAVTFAIARWWAWEPHWLLRWRHATAEAGWRTSAAWAEFRDWVRLGR